MPDLAVVSSSEADKNASSARKMTAVVAQERLGGADELAGARIDGVSGGRRVPEENDIRHTIRGESVLERSKRPPQAKKGSVDHSPGHGRRKSPKPESSVGSGIAAKMVLLLAALLWMGHTIWSLAHSARISPISRYAALEYDGRISELEASLKKSTRMLQVQLEVVDRKVGIEIGQAARDLTRRSEEKEASLRNELKQLEARTEIIGRSLDELKDMGFLTRGEIESLLDEFQRGGNLSNRDEGVRLDEFRSFARDIVREEIDKHAADGIGRADFALFSGGARVVGHSRPYALGRAKSWLNAANGLKGVDSSAHKMLKPSFGEPGQCFALQGAYGFVNIRLRAGIIPEAVTLEHVSKAVAYDRSSAPKDCRVFGWHDPGNGAQHEPPSGQGEEEMVLLAEFSYDLDKSSAQTFSIVAESSSIVNNVRLEFASNHGHPDLTCIYRFRVHGQELAIAD